VSRTRREHRVEKDDLGTTQRIGISGQLLQHLDRFRVPQFNPPDHLAQIGVVSQSSETIFEHGRNQGIALDGKHAAAGGGQMQGIVPESRGGIDDPGDRAGRTDRRGRPGGRGFGGLAFRFLADWSLPDWFLPDWSLADWFLADWFLPD